MTNTKLNLHDVVLQKLSYSIAQDTIQALDGQPGVVYAQFLQIAALMAYDGERIIRLLEQSDNLMPRELIQPNIDFLTKMLEIADGYME